MIKLLDIITDEIKLKNNKLVISGLSSNSKLVKQDFLFSSFANAIAKNDLYIKNAIENGAVALLIKKENYKKYFNTLNIEVIVVKDPRETYIKICSKYYKLQFKNLVAVTGTNGKTSVAWIVSNIWHKMKIKSASIGTLGVYDGKNILKNQLTTPSIDDLFLNLYNFKKKDFKNIIIEASSHGIHQRRLDGLKFSIVVITSLSRDHLDYHKSYKNYKKAKLRLFDNLTKNQGIAIINDSIEEYKEFVKVSLKNNLKVITIGKKKTSDWCYKVNFSRNLIHRVEVIYKGITKKFNTKLIGDFQINNLVTSMAVLFESGLSFESIIKNIPRITAPPGRLEYIGKLREANIYIDYAHTPDALKNVLKSVKLYVNNNLIIVFGCGGNRDKGKRSIMGKIAHNYADIIYVTDDNPRDEKASKIRKEIIKGCSNAIEIPDRYTAIESAINNIESGDILIILGKGHEEEQIIKNESRFFNDKQVVLEILKK